MSGELTVAEVVEFLKKQDSTAPAHIAPNGDKVHVHGKWDLARAIVAFVKDHERKRIDNLAADL